MVKAALRRYGAATSLAAVAVMLLAFYGIRKAQSYAADPVAVKDCGAAQDTENSVLAAAQPRTIAPVEGVTWKQLGGTINDASCLNRVEIYGIVDIRTVEDVHRTLAFARQNGLTVSVAGVRHSMGGQAFRKGGIVLDTRNFNQIRLNEAAKTVTVQAGATWHDIQNVLHPRFAIRAMQSTDIFSVGGSISVNAHGMDHQACAMARSIRSMHVMLADGSIEQASPSGNRELFDLVVGGYGLFGVILDAELDVVDNVMYRSGRTILDYRDFPVFFAEQVEPNHSIGLMYAHLSTAPSSFLRETLVYTYTQLDGVRAEQRALPDVTSTKLRRLVINLSKRGTVWKELKWFSEKYIEPRVEACSVSRRDALGTGEACLVSRNEPMHDSVPYLRNNLVDETDILHEYFVPRKNLVPFIDGMREVLRRNAANLLNASIRVVHAEDNFLSYSPEPAFSVVLYINQNSDEEGTRRMRKLTGELIELTLSNGGRFFLPYQLHYTPDQLKRSYPQIAAFFAAKRRYDPAKVLSNSLYESYGNAILTR